MRDTISSVLVTFVLASIAFGCALPPGPEGEDVAFDQPEHRAEKAAAEARRLPGEKANGPLPATVDAARRGTTIQAFGGGGVDN